MNRSSFLKALATIVVAPAVLYSQPVNKLPEPEKEWICMSLKVPTDLYEDSNTLKHFIFEEMRWRKLNPENPYTVQHGWENDDFTKNMVTIIIRQETKYMLAS